MRCHWCDAWFEGRSDSKFCSVRCRQASWRFGVRRGGPQRTDRAVRVAYADPPYPGLAHYYPENQEVDHTSLLERLQAFDGWALSTSAVALAGVLRLCPSGVRVCSWVKRERSGSAWEPVIVKSARASLVPDALVYRGRFNAFPGAMIGMKPPQFCVWLFGLLGVGFGDSLDDLFPGSGAVSLAWARYVSGSPGADAFYRSSRAGGDALFRETSVQDLSDVSLETSAEASGT